jgi:hypothetical protein
MPHPPGLPSSSELGGRDPASTFAHRQPVGFLSVQRRGEHLWAASASIVWIGHEEMTFIMELSTYQPPSMKEVFGMMLLDPCCPEGSCGLLLTSERGPGFWPAPVIVVGGGQSASRPPESSRAPRATVILEAGGRPADAAAYPTAWKRSTGGIQLIPGMPFEASGCYPSRDRSPNTSSDT